MNIQEKLALLEDTFEMEAGELKEDMLLEDIESWDSMTKLSLIVLIDDEFGKQLSGNQIKGFLKVKDILDFMG